MADIAPPEERASNGSVPEENKEDAETRAARRELKQSSISDSSTGGANTSTNERDESSRPTTPTANPPKEKTANSDEQILSPKKKRPHDQLDGDKPTDDDRARPFEPEKKRARDGDQAEKEAEPSADDPETTAKSAKSATDDTKSPEEEKQQTQPSAFASSGFGKLATASSPFAALGSSGDRGFGAAHAPSLSSFASPPKPAEPASTEGPKFKFGSAAGVSPFAGLASGSKGFGSTLGSGAGFGSGGPTGVKPLGSFAAPNTKPLTSEKPSKPFGAPDSDSGNDEGDAEEDEENQPDEERAPSPEKESEDKKKPKLHKVEVDSGESGETSVVSVRAKVFHHDKDAGWKERGSGMLKVNVPNACLEFDDAGVPIPGSFDASGLDLDEEKEEAGGKGRGMVRLILRQDQTHRVILNTAVLAATKFQEKASLKSVGILFTAFEGDDAKPVTITVKMSAANAKIFMDEIGVVQRELQSS